MDFSLHIELYDLLLRYEKEPSLDQSPKIKNTSIVFVGHYIGFGHCLLRWVPKLDGFRSFNDNHRLIPNCLEPGQ